MTTTNQFYITSQPLALVSSGNNASISGTFSANAITAPTANLSSITANTVAGQTATFSGNVSANTVAGQTATFSGNVSANTVAGQTATFSGNVSANTVVGQTATFSGNVSASFLVGNGQGITGLAPPVSPMTISSFSVTDINGTALDDTALGESSYLTISGTSFGAGAVAMLGAISASATTGISQTQLRARFTGVAPGTYSLFVLNTDGTSAILPSAVTWSVSPIWDATGTLAASTKTRVFTRNLALANGDSTLTYTLASGSSLPPGTSLLGNGSLTGNIIESSNSTTSYSFTVSATDAQYQDAPKTFQLSSGFLRTFPGNVVVSNSTFTGDTNHLAVSNSGGFVKIVADTPAFAANAIANLGNVTLSSTFISATELRAVVPAATEGTISPLEITNADGSVLTNANIAQWALPVWTTASGQLGANIYKNDAFSRTVAATHGAGNVTYAAVSGFPAGVTVNSGGVISGSTPGGNTNEIATLVLNAISANTLQNATREFTLSLLAQLFAFTSHTFTNAGATGRDGPSLAQCRAAYSTTWDETYLTMTTNGIQRFEIPKSGTYRITAKGAQGGNYEWVASPQNFGGEGAIVRSDHTLTIGTVLQVLVGQMAPNRTSGNLYGAGGGGGSFVVKGTSPSVLSDLLIAAGGGSGVTNNASGNNGVFGLSGAEANGPYTGAGNPNGGAGGDNGNGGQGSSYTGGGGGYLTKGGNHTIGSTGSQDGGGRAFLGGGQGGEAAYNNLANPDTIAGGFGGGGNSNLASGGGGGASGGGGGLWSSGRGGGGGSYSTTTQTNVGTGTGHGYVTIEFIG